MRDILFRGKRIKDGKWMYGLLDDENHGADFTAILPNRNDAARYVSWRVDPDTVGQYTGLQDKNGKRIFEGDIFKFPDEVFESYDTSCGTEYNSWDTENYGVVGFCEFTGRFDFVQYRFNQSSVDADLHENHNMEFHDFVCELEVIGNIHDNPELLEWERHG